MNRSYKTDFKRRYKICHFTILKERMKHFSNNLEFEKLQSVKEKLDLLNNYQLKSTIVNTKINNVDVFSIISDSEYAFINYLKISNGAIIQTHTIEIKRNFKKQIRNY